MIRRIKASDGEAVSEICVIALGHGTTAETVEQGIARLGGDPSYYIAVCEDGGEVVGFIEAQKYGLLYGDDGWNIIALAVLPERQKQGIGKELISSLEELAAERGDSFVRVNSRAERQDAHAFYEHLGYECDKVQKRFIKYL